jgi:hypothetical protein
MNQPQDLGNQNFQSGRSTEFVIASLFFEKRAPKGPENRRSLTAGLLFPDTLVSYEGLCRAPDELTPVYPSCGFGGDLRVQKL